MLVKNKYKEVTDLASKHLGQVGGAGYKDQYDPSLLVAIPRELNREQYSLTGREFTGYDVWNAYEVSALTKKGLPVSGMLKIVCPAETPFHVESKSIKLYLNSFNMTKIGDSKNSCIEEIEKRVSTDLTELLKGKVEVSMITEKRSTYEFEKFRELSDIVDLDEINFTKFESDTNILKARKNGGAIFYRTDLLRSNCRVTNQPDWGDLFIKMSGNKIPTAESLAKYIVSHRQVSHFHEEIVEMIYKHLSDKFKPDSLMVSAFYTRRGGIDINPIRSSHRALIPTWYYDPRCLFSKTLRQ